MRPKDHFYKTITDVVCERQIFKSWRYRFRCTPIVNCDWSLQWAVFLHIYKDCPQDISITALWPFSFQEPTLWWPLTSISSARSDTLWSRLTCPASWQSFSPRFPSGSTGRVSQPERCSVSVSLSRLQGEESRQALTAWAFLSYLPGHCCSSTSSFLLLLLQGEKIITRKTYYKIRKSQCQNSPLYKCIGCLGKYRDPYYVKVRKSIRHLSCGVL